ncbi:beta-hexosaminidase [Holotrichia oblita]|nr:beta-hexosaminidase [Holotrichia oblita]
MSYNKFNVFHWHIVDDQSFPYQSAAFPELSQKGAYNQHQIYTPVDVKSIIEYARLRGIRVVPEFDTPGHTRSWGEGIPELLSSCYKNNHITNQFGPMDPSRDFVFSFLNDFWSEIKSVFPDKYLHLGGDEVPFDCWEDNPDIEDFMTRLNITGDYKALQRYFMERLMNITTSKDLGSIVWEEVFNAGTSMPADAIVQVWYSQYYMLDQVTLWGRRALYSTCWYLDHLSTGGDWKKYYLCDPQNFNGDAKQLKLVLGGEACMWGEVVDSQNVLQRTWPRAAATAEKLWSAYEADTIEDAARRLEEHSCRLNKRGIPAQPPNGPDPGPQVTATKGEVWPKPQEQRTYDDYYVLSTEDFQFNIVSESCMILDEAVTRYAKLIFTEKKIAEKYSGNNKVELKTNHFLGYLTSLDVSLTKLCAGDEFPELDMDESYTLTIPTSASKKALLEASSIWGILRGLETFSQLLYNNNDDPNLYINATKIEDFPRFTHRGLLLDTSRHYLEIDTIYQHLDAMSYNKMNVFHWHIVDDQSFPYQSSLFPELSEKGAYHPQYEIYNAQNVAAIIEYARLRGIRVIPEFDAPGHTRSWGIAIPQLLTKCYKNGKFINRYGPMDPTREFVFSFLDELYGEIKSVFPDKYVHLGGDEVPFDCWKENPEIEAFMQQLHIGHDYKALQRYFMERMLNITRSKELAGIVWEEVFTTDAKMPQDTVVQVWRNKQQLLDQITSKGYRALFSSCWYLDHLQSGGDWQQFYDCDPHDFNGQKDHLKLVIGGEACMWAESVNNENILPRTWPRASATAEKLWSARNADKGDNVKKRLEEHSCRMNKRGIPAQPPNGPGYCLS